MRHRKPTVRKPATTRRVRRLAIAATLTALITGTAVVPAQAAATSPLRWCAATVKTSCVQYADNDEGDLGIRDRHGRIHDLTSSRQALRWLRHHAPRCAEEDSVRCYWNAGSFGNQVGSSFIVIGGRYEADPRATVWYLGNLD